MSPSSSGRFFRQSVPAIRLSLERASGRTPDVRYFYVFLDEEVKGRFAEKARAMALYNAILQSSGYKPPIPEKQVPVEAETVERYLDDLEEYWLNSHRHSKRGGKSMYR